MTCRGKVVVLVRSGLTVGFMKLWAEVEETLLCRSVISVIKSTTGKIHVVILASPQMHPRPRHMDLAAHPEHVDLCWTYDDTEMFLEVR